MQPDRVPSYEALYLEESGLKILEFCHDGVPDIWMQSFRENLEHVVEPIETDEFVLAVDVVDAGQAAQPFAVALGIETNHDYFLSGVRGALFAECAVLLKAHLTKNYT